MVFKGSKRPVQSKLSRRGIGPSAPAHFFRQRSQRSTSSPPPPPTPCAFIAWVKMRDLTRIGPGESDLATVRIGRTAMTPIGHASPMPHPFRLPCPTHSLSSFLLRFISFARFGLKSPVGLASRAAWYDLVRPGTAWYGFQKKKYKNFITKVLPPPHPASGQSPHPASTIKTITKTLRRIPAATRPKLRNYFSCAISKNWSNRPVVVALATR